MQEKKQENSPIKKRILQYLSYKNISEYAFYKESGITRGILNQKTGISEDNLTRFLAYAQDVSTKWVLLGQDNMIIAKNNAAEHEDEFGKSSILRGPECQFEFHKVTDEKVATDFYLKKYIEQLELNLNEKKEAVKEKEKTIQRLWEEIDFLRLEKSKIEKAMQRHERIKNDAPADDSDLAAAGESLTG